MTAYNPHPPQAESGPYDLFISVRFNEALGAAKALKAALTKQGFSVFLCAVAPGGDIATAIIDALHSCKMVIILGSPTYGEKTENKFISTFEELRYIIHQDKPFFLVKMCAKFLAPAAQFYLTNTIAYHAWRVNGNDDEHDVPESLVTAILDKYANLPHGENEKGLPYRDGFLGLGANGIFRNPMTSDEADKALLDRQDAAVGDFLLWRRKPHGQLTISVVTGAKETTHHAVTNDDAGQFLLDGTPLSAPCQTLADVVAHLTSAQEIIPCSLQHQVRPPKEDEVIYDYASAMGLQGTNGGSSGGWPQLPVSPEDLVEVVGDVRVKHPWSWRRLVALIVVVLLVLTAVVAVPVAVIGVGTASSGRGNKTTTIAMAITTTPTTTTATTTSSPATTPTSTTTSTTVPCTSPSSVDLDCASSNSRAAVSLVNACGVSEVFNCCCEEFYALSLVTGSITVTDFAAALNFGGVTSISGSVFASSLQLTSVDFGHLRFVGGTVDIGGNNLTTLNLNQLSQIGGDFNMQSNHLTALHLGALQSVGGDLTVTDNVLTAVNFMNVVTVGGTVDLNDNFLVEVDLGALQQVGGDFLASGMFLTSVNLLGLERVGGTLSFSSNDITTLDMGALTSVERLSVGLNPLTTLDLKNISSLYELAGTGNQVTSVDFGKVTSIEGSLHLRYSNKLKSLDFTPLQQTGEIQVDHSPLSEVVDFGTLTRVNGGLFIHASQLFHVNMTRIEHIDGFLNLANSLASIDFQQLTFIGGDIQAYFPKLATLNFQNVREISGVVRFSVGDIESVHFGDVTRIGEGLFLSDNNIRSIAWDNLTVIDGPLHVQGNSLTNLDCQGLGTCLCVDASVNITNCPELCGDC
ncbi:hypothetical protein PTSG_03080 [Salpingoeca rosetta]|uniref:SH2 domain-containing protein n=1 Tax=Salpingoeca rosetta (strain ATCC 50818 / BSB-021) TaxID=946362 RepID=F2U468_SALR5|nr:uncharacterized protein PTSG_03080 [Salpingoeca rosetta]EGD82434.1 hypothetical protein PTSG_03080 [Salpingoeca rosetta]|eukprot:XP_004995670.1 hypothetical protein PTSG_03080 [Salpingoeca rosetta]